MMKVDRRLKVGEEGMRLSLLSVITVLSMEVYTDEGSCEEYDTRVPHTLVSLLSEVGFQLIYR